MNNAKIRGALIALPLLALIIAHTVWDGLIELILIAVCMLGAVGLLYRHLGDLTDVSPGNPKINTLKQATIFTAVIFFVMIGAIVLAETGLLVVSEEQAMYAVAILVAVAIFFYGNIAPKLPWNRHTGLRLPWTVTDEDTWIVAHRILSYLSIPVSFLLLAGMAVVTDARQFAALIVGAVFLWVGIPSVLSLIFYWKKQHGKL